MSIFNFKKEEISHWKEQIKFAEGQLAMHEKAIKDYENIINLLKKQCKEMKK